MLKKSFVVLAATVAFSGFTTNFANAEEMEISAASCFPQGSFFSRRFESLIETVNEKGAGTIKINYVGGAPAIGSPFTLVQKASQGAYDLVSCTGAYYQNVVPEADAWKLLERTPAEIRENGGWELMTNIHRDKGLVPLSRVHYGTQFHLFLGEGHAIDKPDLSGLHLRVAPIYTNFFKALGATTQNSNLAQIYTLMENGTVAGYGWPVIGHQPGWDQVTKYRVDPGFYDVDIEFLANAASWDKLSDEAKGVIQNAAMAIENDAVANDAATAEGAAAKQADTFEIITFEGEDRDNWVNTAREAGWAGLIEASPEHGPALREAFSRE